MLRQCLVGRPKFIADHKPLMECFAEELCGGNRKVVWETANHSRVADLCKIILSREFMDVGLRF